MKIHMLRTTIAKQHPLAKAIPHSKRFSKKGKKFNGGRNHDNYEPTAHKVKPPSTRK